MPQKEATIDKENLAGVLEKFPKQIVEASALGKDLVFSGFRNVVICGMGGSGLPGEFVRSIVDSKIPIFVVKDYVLPAYVDNYSLVFAVSYSGNTEETLTAYEEARQRGARIVVITSGGELAKKAKENGFPVIVVPGGIPPRMAIGYQMIPLLNVLERCGFLRAIDWKRVADFLTKELKDIKKQAHELAKKVDTKIPLIYASPVLYAVAYKWKKNFNENVKMHAFSNFFPEFNHNEINGYVKLNGKYIVFILRDRDDHPRNKHRMDVVAQLIKEKGVDVIHIDSKGPDRMSRMLRTVWLGDWVAYYTALALGVDPTPVKIIEDLKKALK